MALLVVAMAFMLREQFGADSKAIDRLNIYMLDTPNATDWTECHILYASQSYSADIQARIKTRGGYSVSFPKKSYEIDIEDDYPLGGLPPDDDWILNANYIDKTFLRHTLSYDLFREMGQINKSAHYDYLELYVNDEYQGLYVLMEKLDKSSLSISTGPNAFIFKEPHVFKPEFLELYTRKDSNSNQQIFPDYLEENHLSDLVDLHTLLLDSSNNNCHRIWQYLNIENIADWHLLLLLTNNSDGLLKNFYLYKSDDDPLFYIAPWDYDHSFGRDGDNEYNLGLRQIDCSRSLLFKYLITCPQYVDFLIGRWDNLNSTGVFNVDALSARVNNMASFLKPYVQKNSDKWPHDHKVYYDSNNFDEEVALMLEYINNRHAYVDSVLLRLQN